MATLFEVRQNKLLTIGDGEQPAVPLSRMGIPAYTTKWDLLALMGRMYNTTQTVIGTALAGSAPAVGGIVLTAPWVRFTVPVGYTIFPRHLNVAFATAAGTDNEVAFCYTQTDSFTSSTGAALVINNWRSDNPRATSMTNAYVGASATDNIEAALVGVRALYQDVVPATFAVEVKNQYVVDKWFEDFIPIIGPASVLLFVAGATATPTGYFTLDWAEVATVNVKEG